MKVSKNDALKPLNMLALEQNQRRLSMLGMPYGPALRKGLYAVDLIYDLRGPYGAAP